MSPNPSLFRLGFRPLPMIDEVSDEASSVEADAAHTKVARTSGTPDFIDRASFVP